MGQANKRGTYEERRQQALERKHLLAEQRQRQPTRQRKPLTLLAAWTLGAGTHYKNF